MSGWNDLVTTALLGTDRRPLPQQLPEPMATLNAALDEPDPAGRLLDLAASYSIVDRTQDQTMPGQDSRVVPRSEHAAAPAGAGALLTELLAAGTFGLVNAWLMRCVDHDRVIATGQWVTVLTAAVRHRSVDRRLVARALGRRGLWFAGLNPDWAPLHRALEKANAAESGDQPGTNEERSEAAPAAPAGRAPSANGSAPPTGPQPTGPRPTGPQPTGHQPTGPQRSAERETLERVLQTPQPWPDDVTRAGLGASCRASRREVSTTLLERLAFGMPLAAYPLIGEAADCFLADERSAYQVLVQIEAVVHDRIRIDTAFGSPPAAGPRMIIHHPVRSLP